MQNAGIIRNRLKIQSTITNAKAYLELVKECGGLDQYLWAFVDGKTIVNSGERIITTALSDQISKDLKKRGFKFVGSTIIYAYMQAIGMVSDHAKNCAWRTIKQ
jgi:DNA-3-methyladenine glycosylase I